MSRFLILVFSYASLLLFNSCDKDEYYIEELVNVVSDEEYEMVGKIGIKISGYMSQSAGGYVQGADCYGDYLFQFLDSNSAVNIYNLREKKYLETVEMIPNKSNHCNNISFSRLYYKKSDVFPLLYVSSCRGSYSHLQVYRILLRQDSSFSIEQVQEIILPKATHDNNLYWTGAVIDNDNNFMYIYANTNGAQIAKFNIPDVNQEEVVLTDEDILEQFTLEKFTHQQGAVIYKGMMYVFDGVPQWGDTNYLRIIDLVNRDVFAKINISEKGLKAEPEGAFIYNDILYCATNNSGIFKVKLDFLE